MQDKEKGSFSFINEKIKAKPLNKKRLVIRTVFVVAMAVIFGLVSALVFTYFQPKFENMLYPEEKPMVTIPKDDTEETEEPVSESSETEETEQKDTQAESGNAGTETQGTEKSELEIADFQKLQNKLYAVGREAVQLFPCGRSEADDPVGRSVYLPRILFYYAIRVGVPVFGKIILPCHRSVFGEHYIDS